MVLHPLSDDLESTVSTLVHIRLSQSYSKASGLFRHLSLDTEVCFIVMTTHEVIFIFLPDEANVGSDTRFSRVVHTDLVSPSLPLLSIQRLDETRRLGSGRTDLTCTTRAPRSHRLESKRKKSDVNAKKRVARSAMQTNPCSIQVQTC